MKTNRTINLTKKTISIIIVILTFVSTFVCSNPTSFAAERETIEIGDNVEKKALDDGSNLFYTYNEIEDCFYNPDVPCTPDVEFIDFFVKNDTGFYELEKNIDYTITYENNHAVGIATAKVIGINNYDGLDLVDVNFNILPDVQKEITLSIITTNNQIISNGQKQIEIYTTDEETVATYVSDNEDVVSVDENGVVAAVAVGTANVTVVINEKEYVCVVNVVEKQLNTNNITLYTAKDPNSTTLKVVPEGDVTWKSSDRKIASVTKDGTVTANKKGTAVITGIVNDNTFEVKVTCIPPTVKRIVKTLYIGNKEKLWKISNASVYTFKKLNKKYKSIRVEKNGKVTGLKRTKHVKYVVLTVTYKDKTVLKKKLKLKVHNPSVKTKFASLCVGQRAVIHFNSGKKCKLTKLTKTAKEVNVKKSEKTVVVRVKNKAKGIKKLFTVKVNGVKVSFKTKLKGYNFGVKDNKKVKIGNTLQLNKVSGITFKVNNNCADVDNNGVLTAKKVGTVKISANARNVKIGSKSIIVKALPIRDIQLNENLIKSNIELNGKEAKRIVKSFSPDVDDASTNFFECRCTNSAYENVTSMAQLYTVKSSDDNIARAEVRNDGIYVIGGTNSGTVTVVLYSNYTKNTFEFNVAVDAKTVVPETYEYTDNKGNKKVAVLIDSETELIDCLIDASRNYILKGEKYKYYGVECDAVAINGFWEDKNEDQKTKLIYNKIKKRDVGLYDLMAMNAYCGAVKYIIFRPYDKKHYICDLNYKLGFFDNDAYGTRNYIPNDFYKKIAKPVIDKANTLETRYEKAWYIFSWVNNHVWYSFNINDGGPCEGLLTTYNKNKITDVANHRNVFDEDTGENWTFYGKGVCVDFTFLANYLCTLANVPVVAVKSDALNHMWSAVQCDDGKWYFCDATGGAESTSYETETGFKFQYMFMHGYYDYTDERCQNDSYWEFMTDYNVHIEKKDRLKYEDFHESSTVNTIEDVTQKLKELGYPNNV